MVTPIERTANACSHLRANQQPVAKLPLSLMVVAFMLNSHCDSSYAELP